MKKWLVGIALAGLTAGCVSHKKATAVLSPSPTSTPGSTISALLEPFAPGLSDDEKVAIFKRDNSLAPALDWLNDPKNILWKGDRQELIRLFHDLGRAGAREILAHNERVKDRQLCTLFVITLPKGAARKQIFEKYNHFRELQSESETWTEKVDAGQHYLVYDLEHSN